MVIRPLTAADTACYQPLRLRGLREHPEAFASAFEEEQQFSWETVATRLQQSSAERYVLGAFEGEELSGLLHFRRWEGLKIRHRASIGGMYVPPESRRRGIGKALLLDAIIRAQTLSGLEDLILAVTVGNEQARALYRAAGFTSVTREPRYLKISEQYFAIEWMHLEQFAVVCVPGRATILVALQSGRDARAPSGGLMRVKTAVSISRERRDSEETS